MHKPRTAMLKARTNLNLTHQELADIAEVSRAYIVNIEAGRYTPSLEVAYRIAKALNKSIEEIFFVINVRKMNKKKSA